MKKQKNYALLAVGLQHLYGLFSNGTRLHGLLLGHQILGHGAELGHGLVLAAAGAESYGTSNGYDESGEFHIQIWLNDSDVYSSKFTQNSQYKFPGTTTFCVFMVAAMIKRLKKQGLPDIKKPTYGTA